MELHCEIGMKATLSTQSEQHHGNFEQDIDEDDIPKIKIWPSQQRGREITVYIYQYCSQYGKGPMDSLSPDDESHLYQLSQDFEAGYDVSFWFNFIRTVERHLKQAGIRSRGTADGDLALPSCLYASLRNEAFVRAPVERIVEEYPLTVRSCGLEINAQNSYQTDTGNDLQTDCIHCDITVDGDDTAVRSKSIPFSGSKPYTPTSTTQQWEVQYPPNNMGWNAAGHFNPMIPLISCLRVLEEEMMKTY